MTSIYNLTAIAENSTNIVTMTQTVNSAVTEGWLGNMILISLTAIFFAAFMSRTGDPTRSIAGSAYIALILSILLRALDLIPDLTMYIVLIGTAAAVAFTWKNS